MESVIREWTDFNVAIAGATAALAGLVIVAASVNIADIVKSRTLTARLGSGIVMLVLALVVSAIGLMPGIDGVWFGVAVVSVALVATAFQVATARLLVVDHNPRDRGRWAKALLGFLPAAAYLVAGLLTLGGVAAGLYAAAAGAVLAIVAALIVSWVALVEVLR